MAATPEVPTGLTGRWELLAGPAGAAPMTGFGIHLVFAEGSVGGRSGVNLVRGTYTMLADPLAGSGAAGILAFGPMAATLMAGPPAAMAAEQEFLKAIGAVRGYTLVGQDTLQLADEAGALLLTFGRADEPPRAI